ncbi:MAG: PilZ domain-containing protein [Planctomycetes bacterium]|nr:PilZ domain-containing protein [Planctomycetota bacterium]
MPAVETTEQSVDELLAAACDRSVVLRLHYEDSSGAQVIGNTRIRSLNERQILADAISFVDKRERIPVGRPLWAHFKIRGDRHQFQTVIENSRVPVEEPGRDRSYGVALRRPPGLSESQRRAHVRVSVAAGDAIQVFVAPRTTNTPNACAVDAAHPLGRMLNVAAGGMTVLVPIDDLRRSKENDRFFLTFTLPEFGGDFHLLGSLRHTRKVEKSDSLRVSFAFKTWDGSELRNDQRRIERFIVEREREILRRRK